MEVGEITSRIKQKKELQNISNSLILGILLDKIKKNKINISLLAKNDIKVLIKEVRAELRKFVGQFQISPKKKAAFLNENNFSEILKVHSSTKERINFYPQIIDLLNKLKIKSILDLGCGINPIAIASKSLFYNASDINNSDLDVVKAFFAKNNIDGKVFVHDLRADNSSLPKADMCLLFKVLDTIEKRGHKIAESLILNLKCRYILASFSTRKLSGKKMNFPRRLWLERMLAFHNLKYKSFESENELFYLIEKSTI